MAFYTTDTFNDSILATAMPSPGVDPSDRRPAAVLNVLESIRSGNEYDPLALRVVERKPAAARRFVKLAIKETTDAIQVLNRGPVALLQESHVGRLLRWARSLEKRAIRRKTRQAPSACRRSKGAEARDPARTVLPANSGAPFNPSSAPRSYDGA